MAKDSNTTKQKKQLEPGDPGYYEWITGKKNKEKMAKALTGQKKNKGLNGNILAKAMLEEQRKKDIFTNKSAKSVVGSALEELIFGNKNGKQ